MNASNFKNNRTHSSMKDFAKTIQFVNCFCLISFAVSHSIEIYNWNVTRFLQEDGNATAAATLGESVTWSLSNGGVWQISSEKNYYDCFFDDAKEVEGGVYQTWAAGVERGEKRRKRTKEINTLAARKVVPLEKESRLLSSERNLRERITTCVLEVL